MAAFTTIAAGIGLAATAGSTAMSFGQAAKQRKAQEEAERKAEESMAQARKRLEVNYADALSIQKEPYELQREALLSQGAQALQAGVESERGGAATAGRVLAAQQQGQGAIRSEMGKDLFNLEAMQAEEDSRLRDLNTQLDLGEAQGAQQAAAEAEEKAAMFKNQAIQGVVNTVGQAAAMAPLFGKNAGVRQGNTMLNQGGGVEGVQKSIGGLQTTNGMYNGVDITPLQKQGLTNAQFQDFMGQQSGDWARGFRRDMGIQTGAGRFIGNVVDAFGNIIR